MNASVNPRPQTSTPASGASAAGASAAKSLVTGVGNAVGATADAAGRGADAVTSIEPTTIWGKVTKFISSFTESGAVGKTLGGIAGLVGAWFLGNFFGGGIMSTILTIALAIPLMLVGSDSIGGWINGMLGNKQPPAAGEDPSKDKTPVRAVARTNGQEQPSVATQPSAAPAAALSAVGPTTALTNEEILAYVAPADNLRDRVYLSLDASKRVQVSSVADSAPEGPGVHSLESLRQMVLAKGGSLVTGIAFTPMSDGGISVSAANIGNTAAPQGRG
jgi:hypothetical protein